MHNYLGILAALVSFSAYALYIFSVFQGKTKPSRSTWWILTLIGFLLLTSSYSIGAKENLGIQICYVLGPLIIAFQSLKYGQGTRLQLIDKICLGGAFVCLLIWIIFNSPLIVFLGSIIIDFIGLVPTIKKSYFKPSEEDPLAWTIETIASFLNAVGVTVWFQLSDKSWIYALYLLTINSIIMLILLDRSLKNKR